MKGSNLAFIFWGAAIAIGGAASLAHSLGIRINHTPSLPVGVWRISALDGPLPRGRIVAFCPLETEMFRDALRRKTIAPGMCPGGWEPMLKPVAAIAGDHVELSHSGVEINGAVMPGTIRVPYDFAIPFGSYNVSAGEIWVLAAGHSRSFDSRYFGPIPITQVEGVADPVLIWPSGSTIR